MKKIFTRISLVILVISLMGFRECGLFINPLNAPPIESASGMSIYPPLTTRAENDTLYYSLYVGSDGKINRSTGRIEIIFEDIESGTTETLNAVRTSNNYYQNLAAIAGNNGTVLVSDNTGLTWTIKSPVTSANLYGVDHNYFLFAVGDNGTILYASEIITGNLILQNSGTSRNLKGVSISRLNNQYVIVVGEKGTILRTTDTGFNWENVSIPDTNVDFNSISQQGVYNSADVFVAVGTGGKIYKSTDTGATWEQKSSGTTSNLTSVFFLTPDSGIVAGDNGTIILTTNGGNSWFTDNTFISPPGRNFKSVSCIHKESQTYSVISDSLFIVSNEEIIVADVEQNETFIISGYLLSQNYPNPFNPSTKISWQSPVSGHQTLKIYDVLGNEVATLVDEYREAGRYELLFDASNLSSGIYFYRLEAGSFVETKKMILLQ